MSILDSARVIIYRYHEKGLEIFLINNEMEKDAGIWRIPQGLVKQWQVQGRQIIDLDETEDEAGHTIKTIAIGQANNLRRKRLSLVFVQCNVRVSAAQ